MPVERFRDPDEASSALWTPSDDPDLVRRIARLWARTARLAPPLRSVGVRRFGSIDEANEHRERAVDERVCRLRQT